MGSTIMIPRVGNKKRRYVLPTDDRGNYVLRTEPLAPPRHLIPKPRRRSARAFTCLRRSNISGKLIPSHGSVPAPVMRACFGLIQCFDTWRVPVDLRGVSPTGSINRIDTDAVVIGTFASMPRL